MSADKLEAVREALADVFNESNLNATSTETSHAAFDHKTLSEAFSEPHLNVANTEQSFARFEHAALTGMFGEPSTEKPPPTSFDQSFADLLSERPPLASDTHQPRPGFDHQGFAEILSEPPPVSTNTKPSQPSFDHQALAEMLTESRADPINPPTSPLSFDTEFRLHLHLFLVKSSMRSRWQKPLRLPLRPTRKVRGRREQSRYWPNCITYFRPKKNRYSLTLRRIHRPHRSLVNCTRQSRWQKAFQPPRRARSRNRQTRCWQNCRPLASSRSPHHHASQVSQAMREPRKTLGPPLQPTTQVRGRR